MSTYLKPLGQNAGTSGWVPALVTTMAAAQAIEAAIEGRPVAPPKETFIDRYGAYILGAGVMFLLWKGPDISREIRGWLR